MDELNTIRTLVTLGGVFASIAGAWWLMRYQIGELRTADEKQGREIAAMWKKIEEAKEKLSLVEQKLGVVSGMLRPEAVSEHNKWMSGVTKDLQYIRRDLDRVDARTACKECK